MLTRTFLALVVIVGSGCGVRESASAPLASYVSLEQSPSKEFAFCAQPPTDSAVHLENATWLSFIAANEYTHAQTFGPLLTSLGFHNPDDSSDLAWAECTADLRKLREVQASHVRELEAVHTSRSRAPTASVRLASGTRPSPSTSRT